MSSMTHPHFLSMSTRLLVLCSMAFCFNGRGADLINDKAITIRSASDVLETRKALINYLWGQARFPLLTRFPDRVVTNIPTPVHHLEHLKRVDELRMDLTPGLEGLAYHFVPERPN